MLTIYIAATIIGGILVVVSALGGSDGELDHEAEMELEADFDADIDAGVDVDVDAHADGAWDSAAWLPFLSLRFWTYFLAFFGLSGLLLSTLTNSSWATVVSTAGATGFVCGFAVATLMRFLKKTQADSGVGSGDMVGAEGRVLLPIRIGETGKVRVQIKGDLIDLLALVDGDTPLEPGIDVIIVGFKDNTATVIPKEQLVARLTAGRPKVITKT